MHTIVSLIFMGINFREISERMGYSLGRDPGKLVFNEYICETAVFHRHVASGGGGGGVEVTLYVSLIYV